MFADVQPESAFIYAVSCIVLCLNLCFLWVYSGVVRHKTKGALNPEDSTAYGVALVEQNPPEVARVLRAHENAQAAITPFLFMGLVFVLIGGAVLPTLILFALFTLARLAHSYCYLAAKQPGRSITFGFGLLATLGVIGGILVVIVQKMSIA